MRKKLIAIILILIIFVGFTIPSYIYAEPDSGTTGDSSSTGTFKDVQEYQSEHGQEIINKAVDEKKAEVRPSNSSARDEDIGETATSSSLTVGVLGEFFALFPQVINGMMNSIIFTNQKTTSGSTSSTSTGSSAGSSTGSSTGSTSGSTAGTSTGSTSSSGNNGFTIQGIVFGKYTLFDINFFEFDTSSNNINDKVKISVSQWYFALRNIAIVANLLLLVYIGIRMAISTVSEQQARYKKMFFNWFVSFLLLFNIHYVLIIFFEAQKILIDIISSFTGSGEFESDILQNTWKGFAENKGWGTVVYVIEIFIQTFYRLKFFWVYAKRFLTVGLLLIISPLISVMDAIYSVDQKLPIFKKWTKEITYNVILQVIHAAVYAVFILSASEIAKQIPIVGMLMLIALSRTEQIVRSTLKLNGKGIADVKLLDKIKSKGAKTP